MQKKFTPLIVEDDPLIVTQLEEFLAKTQLFEKPFVSETCTGAMSYLRDQAIDLLFLDIEMPDMNGLDFLRSFPIHCPLVIVSSHPQYAIDCFDYDVDDFLTKPLTYTRFLRSIRRTVLPSTPRQQSTANQSSAGIPTQGTESAPTHIYMKTGHINQRFALSEILYLEASNLYTKIITPMGATVVSDQISNLAERLGKEQFLRVHKSYVVNLEQITRYSAKTIWIQNHSVPIGRTYQAEARVQLPKVGKKERV